MMASPMTSRPAEDGIVSRKTRPSDCESVRRKSSISPLAAAREMAGSVAPPMATPNRPSGSCMKRKAQPSQVTGPLKPVTGSLICEAKFEFTMTLICTAALPRMAGPMSLAMWMRPG